MNTISRGINYRSAKILIVALLFWPAHLPASTAPAVAMSANLSITDAVDQAVANDPGIAALGAASRALAAVPAQVGALADPMLSINAMNVPVDTFDLDQEAMTQLQLVVSQAIPFPGKRPLQQDVAMLSATAAANQQSEYRDALIRRVRVAWWQLFETDRALDIVSQTRQLLQDFVQIAEVKYAVGKGLQQDVLLAQLELMRLLTREAHLRGTRASQGARLNGLLNRAPYIGIALASEPGNKALPVLPVGNDLINSALSSRKLLDVQRDRLSAADKRLHLAERQRYPNFKAGLGYGARQGGRADFVSVMFSMNLPVYSKRKQAKFVQQQTAEREHQAWLLDDVLRQVRTEIGQYATNYIAASEQVLLLETAVIPLAEQTVDSMLAGYQVSQVDFLNVINGQLMLHNARIDYWKSLSNAKQSLARLAAAVGEETLYE